MVKHKKNKDPYFLISPMKKVYNFTPKLWPKIRKIGVGPSNFLLTICTNFLNRDEFLNVCELYVHKLFR